MNESNTGWKRDAAIRTANGAFQTWATRTDMAKQERKAASDASDANTIRLKALRLEKERADAQAAAANPTPVKAKRAQTVAAG